MAGAPASVRKDGDALSFAGALDRAAAATLWPQARALAPGARRFDLSAVASVDSAGLALLAELASLAPGVEVIGTPPGLAELRDAYRLDDALGFGR
ncbi:STAS domain-containing protein [Lysobacter sp. BMK333-48F3]|uniref:STAS domain-containing protein n=1 Tax=Lysobacter sp. BMK333-48F3 TaxID=2867962 RepID=UPI001C8BCC4C|nr:STAS domain-containing protein [Lysobacter sp. BMK333-48F3]MBX9401087.1 STAS domain-containing protein [Lysobacter sp. BMK333-48F3]